MLIKTKRAVKFPMFNYIEYKIGGYKYQIIRPLIRNLHISLPHSISSSSKLIEISPSGKLLIHIGYAWDGPSGPTIDTKNFMRGSLVHDALYQLMREKLLPIKPYKELADKLLREICIEDGMSKLRAWYVYHSVRLFGNAAVSPKNRRRICVAP